jgi:hypothetical protein
VTYYKYELLVRSGETAVTFVREGWKRRQSGTRQWACSSEQGFGLLLIRVSSRVKAWWAQGITECLLIDCVAKLELGWCHARALSCHRVSITRLSMYREHSHFS